MANYDNYDRSVGTDQGASAPSAVPSTGGDIGPVFCIRKIFTAATTGSADDITLYAAAVVPQKLRILDSKVIITTGVSSSTVTLRDTAAGAGTALSSAMSSGTTGATARDALTAASSTITTASGLFLRRSDRAVAGEVIVFLQPEQ